jgi:hypothetical protein
MSYRKNNCDTVSTGRGDSVYIPSPSMGEGQGEGVMQ